MNVYTITVEETISQNFKIEAATPEEAVKQARRLYGTGELVVDAPNVEAADFFYFPEDEKEKQISMINDTLTRGRKERT